MEGSWFIKGHHLAVKSGGNEYHPTAQEIYSAMDGLGINGISCGSPSDKLSGLRYSKFGSEVSVRLKNDANGKISIEIYAVRRGDEIPIDVIDGRIIDQCVYNGTWFYLQEMFRRFKMCWNMPTSSILALYQ